MARVAPGRPRDAARPRRPGAREPGGRLRAATRGQGASRDRGQGRSGPEAAPGAHGREADAPAEDARGAQGDGPAAKGASGQGLQVQRAHARARARAWARSSGREGERVPRLRVLPSPRHAYERADDLVHQRAHVQPEGREVPGRPGHAQTCDGLARRPERRSVPLRPHAPAPRDGAGRFSSHVVPAYRRYDVATEKDIALLNLSGLSVRPCRRLSEVVRGWGGCQRPGAQRRGGAGDAPSRKTAANLGPGVPWRGSIP